MVSTMKNAAIAAASMNLTKTADAMTVAMPMHTNMKDLSIIYSFDPENKLKKNTEFMGFEIKGKDEEKLDIKRETVLEGIYGYQY